jgi:hypothetical protein
MVAVGSEFFTLHIVAASIAAYRAVSQVLVRVDHAQQPNTFRPCEQHDRK